MSAGEVIVRPLTADDDLTGFGQNLLESYLALPGHPADPGYDTELADVAGRMQVAAVIGAFDSDTTPLGCLTYIPDHKNPYAENLRPEEASFRMLGVAPAAQGRGIAKALVSWCIDAATDTRKEVLFIYSGEWMHAAHKLYERVGFKRSPERDWEVSLPIGTINLRGFELRLNQHV